MPRAEPVSALSGATATLLVSVAGGAIVQISVTPNVQGNFVPIPITFPQQTTVFANTRVVLSTIRVPISAFPAVTKPSDIKGIVVSFAGSSVTGEILLSAPRLSTTV